MQRKVVLLLIVGQPISCPSGWFLFPPANAHVPPHKWQCYYIGMNSFRAAIEQCRNSANGGKLAETRDPDSLEGVIQALTNRYVHGTADMNFEFTHFEDLFEISHPEVRKPSIPLDSNAS